MVFNAPIDVQLSDHDIVQPDLVVLLKATKARVTPTKISGSPDLLVEITSASTADHDRRLKRRVYERSGVAEYWIVEPDEPSVTQLVLHDGEYVETFSRRWTASGDSAWSRHSAGGNLVAR